MISVSNEFKKAIKNSERKIKGYVEVLYDLPDKLIISQQTNSNITSTYTSIDEITNGVRVENLYGSLDYLPLNGEYLTMDNGLNTNAGYISDDLVENLSLPNVTISFTQTRLNGITMYFRNNIPKTLRIICSDDSIYNIENNDKEMVQVIFDTPKNLTYVTVAFFTMEYSDRKIYINEIDLGITQVYKDQDLIEFTVDEEVNKLVEEVPINETNITLNNMSNLFNPLNPKGIVPYLSENSLIIPHIGVFTDNSGIEYVKMGEFYFDNYTNNSDSTTTLTGKNIIKQLEKEILNIDRNGYSPFRARTYQEDFEEFMDNYDYEFNNLDFYPVYNADCLNNIYLLNYLKDISLFNNTLLFADRNNKLNLKNIDTNIKDNLTKTELIKDAKFIKIDKINTFIYPTETTSSIETVANRVIYDTNVTLEKSSQYILCSSSIPNLGTSYVSQTTATSAEMYSSGNYLCFVKVTGTVGNTVNFKLSSQYNVNIGEQINKKTIKSQNEKENTIEINTKLKKDINSINILNYTPSYEMSFDYNGDPSLEAGDYINVETPYGYKPLFIQKNRFKFDGGLEGYIEGVE